MTTLGIKIKRLREKRNLTQTELGNLINVGKSLEKAKKISEAFDMSIDDIFLTSKSK